MQYIVVVTVDGEDEDLKTFLRECGDSEVEVFSQVAPDDIAKKISRLMEF